MMAVYTQVSEDQLKHFLGQYDIGNAISFSGITEGVENSNYRLTTTQGNYILTLYEKRVREQDLPFFMSLLTHIAKNGVNCPEPVADKNGTVLQSLNGRRAAIVTFLQGTSTTNPSPARSHAAAQALAKLHNAAADFSQKRTNALNHLAWHGLLESCKASETDENEGEGDLITQDLIAQAHDRLDSILKAWPTDLPSGLCHADLFPDNVLFNGDKVTGLIDFYFACSEAYAYDLAIMLNAWCFEDDGTLNITKSQHLIAGYQSERHLSKQELEAIPTLCRGSAMRFFLTRLYDWINTPKNAQVKPHDPMQYWRRLDAHFQIKTPQDYGIKFEEIPHNA